MKRRDKIKLGLVGFIIIAVGIIVYTVLYRINKTYDPYEVAQINTFLIQKSDKEQKTNGEMMDYSAKWPLFWGFITLERDGVTFFSQMNSFFDKKGYNRQLSGTLSIYAFKYLKCINFDFNTIDSVIIKNCPKLLTISGSKNNLVFVQIENCPKLETLYLNQNQLKRLDVTGCPNLKELDVEFCPIEKLDVTDYPNLEKLYANFSHIKELIVLETHLWQEWELDSATMVIVSPIL